MPFFIYTSTLETKSTLQFQYTEDLSNSSKMAPIWIFSKLTSNRTLNMVV